MPPAPNRASRAAWTALGFVGVGVGTLGVVLPGLPTVGPFVFAAWCFSKSSPRFERWVLDLPGVGPMVRDHRAGLGMPRRAKVLAGAMIVVACSLSIALGVDRLAVRLAIAAAGAVGVAWIAWRVPTREAVLARRGAGEGL
ncbi:MAG TPA: YbaN family protein [Acidimicrobiales bacterium]|nr:YbaN family protein [Acidimicrobiales bacterium]